MKRAAFILFVAFGLAHAGDQPDQPQRKLDLHVVPTPIKSYRLLSMSMDDDGFIWAGAIHKVVHRYDPRTGKVEDVAMPYRATASSCICVGKKVYILGQSYPKLIIYDRTKKEFTEIAYPSTKPNVWYGIEAIDGRHIFLFDRGGTGVIKWELTPPDVVLFFKLHRALMHFVNQRLQAVPDRPANPDEFSSLSAEVRLKVRDAFLKHTDLIQSFVEENPAHLTDDELVIVRSWQHLVHGKFYVFRQLKKYMVFLSASEPTVAYGVLALSQPFDELVGPYLPVLTETVLLPFRDVIVYDGLMTSYRISFGPGIRRSLNESFKEAKGRHGIVTSLPMSSEPFPPNLRRPSLPRSRRPRKKRTRRCRSSSASSTSFAKNIRTKNTPSCAASWPRSWAVSAPRPCSTAVECVGQRHCASGGQGELLARQEPDAVHAFNRHRPLSMGPPFIQSCTISSSTLNPTGSTWILRTSRSTSCLKRVVCRGNDAQHLVERPHLIHLAGFQDQ